MPPGGQPAPSFARSAALHERAQRSLAGGVSSAFRRLQKPVPLSFVSGRGAHVRDADGNDFVDFTLAYGPLLLGHSAPAVVNAVAAQVARGQTYGAQNELEVVVAEQILRLCPHAGRVTFSTTGTEAVQVALRLARAYTGRTTVIRFDGHYHGWVDNVLCASGPEGRPRSLTEGHAPGALADVRVLPWNDPAALAAALQGGDIAAVICEPILMNAGGLWPQPGYLEDMRRRCTQSGALLIFDEVITGFRVAPGGAAQLLGVAPDLAVYGKALAAGFALSAVAGRADILDLIAQGRVFHAGTLNGNPVALAAAHAVLTEIERDQGAMLHGIQRTGEALQARLLQAFATAGVPVRCAGAGAVFWMHVQDGPPSPHPADFLRRDRSAMVELAVRLLDQHILVMDSGRWYVSAAHGRAEIEAAGAAVERVLADGWRPRRCG